MRLAHVVTGLPQHQIQFQVGHGIAGHEQLKAIEARDQVLFHILRPEPFLPLEFRMYLPHHFGQEGAGAGGRIEHLHAVYLLLHEHLLHLRIAVLALGHRLALDAHLGGVGQPIGQPELGLQDVIHRPHDEAHHRIGRVPHAAALAQLRVVGGQEVLVEMQERILSAAAFAEACQQFCDVGGAEDVGQRIHDPRDAVIQIGPADAVEELAQKGVALGDERGGLLAAEAVQRGVMQSRSEHAVGNGLGVQVRKLLRLQVVDQDRLEGLQLLLQVGVGLRFFVAGNGTF